MADPWQSKVCSRLLRALADPDRLRIMRLLSERACTVTQVAESLNLALANASHHLRTLSRAGLVQDEKHGRFVVYHLPSALIESSTDLDYINLGCCRLEMTKG